LAMDRPWIQAGLKYAVIKKEDLPCLLVQRVARIRPKNEYDSRFITALIDSWEFTHYLLNVQTGTAVPHISSRQISEYKFPKVEEEIQTKVATFRGLFDSNINLNHIMSKKIEYTIAALFRSWFIDFDSVKAKTEGKLPFGMDEEIAALFPDSFEDSELGPIPQGWVVISLGDIAKKTIGGVWGEDKPLPQLQAVRCLRGVDIGHLRNRVRASPPIRWVSNSQIRSRMLENTDILIAGSGAGPLGKTIHCHSNLSNLYTETVVYSNFVFRLRCPSNSEAFFVELTLHHMRQSKEIWSYATGSAIPNLDVHGLLKRRIIKPPQNLIEVFYNEMGDLVDLMNQNVRESNNLTVIRDALLPRLMSGELQVPTEA